MPTPPDPRPLASRVLRALRTPSAAAAGGFLLASVLGGAAFLLPGMTRGDGLGGVDAFFLSVSAVCVTGLAPVADLTAVLTERGWWTLFALVQLGGVGVVFMGALLLSFFGRRLPVRHAQALSEGFADRRGGVGRLVLRVAVLTLACEAAGACVLKLRLGDAPHAWRDAVFHATSAFCNAGFSTYARGLEERAADPVFLLVVVGLVVAGGIGFSVLSETARRALRIGGPLSLHARVAWRTSLLLLLVGAAAFFVLERGAALAGRGLGDGGLAAVFHSASARTAGFNTLPVDALRPATLLLLIGLMIVGGSPGSTAGGMKTVTAAVIFASLRASVLGRSSTTLGRRSIAPEQTQRAMLIALIHLTTLAVVVVGLTLSTEHLVGRGVRFLDLVFESASALGTVGLSTGLTPKLDEGGKLLLCFAMLVGRVGPLTVVLAVVAPRRADVLRYPEERVFLG